MSHPLAGVAEKIKRADVHLHALEKQTRLFIESKPYSVSVEPDAEPGYYLLRASVEREPPLSLSVVLGDLLHNLRSSLDHLVWQLVLGAENEPGDWNGFPIFGDEDEFRKRVVIPRERGKKSALLGVDDQTFRCIERYQPYRSQDAGRTNALGVLAELSNFDKHRLLHPSLFALTTDNPRITGTGYDFIDIMWTTVAIQDGAVLGRFAVYGTTDDEVQMEGTLPVDIRFGEMQIPGSKLGEVRNAVVTVHNFFGQCFRPVDPA